MIVAKNGLKWRDKSYGKITGGQLESVLASFSECWNERTQHALADDPEVAWRRISKLASVPNWATLYNCSLLELFGKFLAVTDTADAIQQAAASADPYTAIAEAIEAIPDEASDHPATLSLAMACVANLEAVAHYSRTINDMLAALRERADFDALGQALSIDSVVITLPICQAMLRYGQLTADSSFAQELLGALTGPHKKRLVYPKLRWAEYLLRACGAFDACSQDEIFELLVVHLKLYGDDREHKDAKKSLFGNFRKWWKEAGIQNPKFSWSAT